MSSLATMKKDALFGQGSVGKNGKFFNFGDMVGFIDKIVAEHRADQESPETVAVADMQKCTELIRTVRPGTGGF